MRIVCWQTILLKYHTFFFRKLGKTQQNLSSAAVLIGALRVKFQTLWASSYLICYILKCFATYAILFPFQVFIQSCVNNDAFKRSMENGTQGHTTANMKPVSFAHVHILNIFGDYDSKMHIFSRILYMTEQYF